MSATITGMDKLRAKLNNIKQTVAAIDKDLFVFCSTLITGIKRRTVGSGADINNQRFARYSRRYIIFKATGTKANKKTGKKGVGGKAVYNVNLFYNGDMLGAIKPRKILGGGEIYFDDAEEHKKAIRHQYGIGGMPQRKFFGLDQEQRKKTMKNITAKVKGAMR